jgi:serine/threonine protein kinase/Flp pilus assembly protein TadD
VVSHYRLIGEIGAGGMGVVWKALDVQLDREVALKFLPPDTTSDPKRRERFIREARSASALNHPGIVTIYEFGSDLGQDFMAMELVRGQSLHAVLLQGPPPRDRVLNWAIQLCDALGKAHRAGIVHRDIKPANIMITEDDFVKVLDFGLAKGTPRTSADPQTEETQTEEQALTAPWVVVGTIGYMSPEQILGEPADRRSDVFSVGAVMYEMTTGKRAFQGNSSADTLRAALWRNPPAPPPDPESGPLFAIILRCLDKSPEARYQDAAELAAALRAIRAMPSSAAATVSPGKTAPRRVRRLAASSIAAAALAGALFVGWKTIGSWRSAGDAEVAATASPTEQYSQARAWLRRYDRTGNVQRAIDALQAVLNQNPKHAGALAALAEGYVRRSVQDPDGQWLKLGLDAANRAIEANPELAAAHAARGMVLTQQRDPKGSTDLEKALQLDPRNAPATLWLGKSRALQGKKQEAEELLRKATSLDDKDAVPWGELAVFYYREARYRECIQAFGRAADIAPDNAVVLKNLGACHHAIGQFGEAAAALQRSLEVEETASTWSNLGTARFFLGEYSDSVKAMQKAVDLSPNNSLYWGNLGDALRWTPGGAAEARKAYTRAIQLAKEKLATSPADITWRSSMAVYLAKSGQTEAALEETKKILDAERKPPSVWYKLALIQEIGGDRNRALASLEAALKAGYSMHEISSEPELAALRRDIRYHRLVMASGEKNK